VVIAELVESIDGIKTIADIVFSFGLVARQFLATR
jgi:hypothetical protein